LVIPAVAAYDLASSFVGRGLSGFSEAPGSLVTVLETLGLVGSGNEMTVLRVPRGLA
jgi:hypothetical protein